MSWKDYKKKMEKVNETVEKADKPKSTRDERFINLVKVDGKYKSITFKLLGGKDGKPFIMKYSHYVKYKGSTVFTNCPTTVKDGEWCSFCQAGKYGWDNDNDTFKKFTRNAEWITNVYVIDDKGNPENNGKVKLFKFKKGIYKTIDKAMNPHKYDSDKKSIEVFDWYDDGSYNFNWNATEVKSDRTGDLVPNYSESEFLIVDGKDVLAESDDECEAIHNQMYDLNEFLDESKYPSLEDVDKIYKKLVGKNDVLERDEIIDDVDEEEPKPKKKKTTPKKSEEELEKELLGEEPNTEDDDLLEDLDELDSLFDDDDEEEDDVPL